jgi:surface polysaccharide O-acyltransferase-like enzyme
MAQIAKDRMVWVDGLRLIAGVSMVGLHASSDINGQPFVDFSMWERSGPVLFRSIMYLARTELFIIISLFLLFMSLDNRPRNYREVIIDQSKRLLRPFIFWVVFYAFYRLLKASYFGYENAIWAQLDNPVDWLGYLVLGDVQYHMHFLPTLFGLILLYPLCLIAIEKPWIGLLVLLALFAKREVDIWLWAHADSIPMTDYLIRFVKIVTYLGYGFVAASGLGLYKRYGPAGGLSEYFNMILFVGVVLYFLKLVYSFRVIEYGNWQFNYTPGFWADFLMPVVLFFLFMSSRRINRFTWLSRLAPYSFGIYLVHPIFMDMAEMALWDAKLNPLIFVLLKATWAVTMSSILVVALSKTPYLGWTVGLGPFPKFSQISRFMNFKSN